MKKKEIITLIEAALNELGISGPSTSSGQGVDPSTSSELRVELEHPEREGFGEWSTNIALRAYSNLQFSNSKNQTNSNDQDLNSKLGEMKSPRELAEAIVGEIKGMMGEPSFATTSSDRLPIRPFSDSVASEGDSHDKFSRPWLSKVEVAGPGFVNFYLKDEAYVEELGRLIQRSRLRQGYDGQANLKDQNVSQNEKNATLDSSQAQNDKQGRWVGKKVSVEYTDPNPFKQFHIGHLYSNVIGESIAKMFEASGATVWRGDFYGDVGLHVAKSVWGMMGKLKIQSSDVKIEEVRERLAELEKLSIAERQKFLGEGYALGVNKYDEDEGVKAEIETLNKLIYVASQEILVKDKGWKPVVDYRRFVTEGEEKLAQVSELYEAGLKWSLEYFEEMYKRLGTKFDGYYPESWVGELGMQIVEKGLEMGVLEKSEGVVVYKGEQDGLHTRVFLNKHGLPTYEAKDLGLARAKYEDFAYDYSLNVFGKEIDEYYKVVTAALSKIEPELGAKAHYLAHGMVNLPEGKMSSRTGNVVTAEWLLDEAKKRVTRVIEEREQETTNKKQKSTNFQFSNSNEIPNSKFQIPNEEMDKIAEMVGQGAVKYALLKSNVGENVTFDFASSVSFEGDSGPYVQYTYARAKSVLRRANDQFSNSNLQTKTKFQNPNGQMSKIDGELRVEEWLKNDSWCQLGVELNPEERAVVAQMARFPEIVERAAGELAPHLVCSYVYELAQRFNSFYNKHSILGGDKNEITNNKFQKTNKSQFSNSNFQSNSNDQIFNDQIAFRLGLTAGVAEVLKTGLGLLGIGALERM